MKSPIKWYGGKYFLRDWLLSHMPKHYTYCEVFGGGAQLLFAKTRSKTEVYNDIDSRLVNFFCVLKDEFDEFYRKCEVTPFSRELFEKYKRDHTGDHLSSVEKAHRFYVACRQSFGGAVNTGWNMAITSPNRAPMWLRSIERLPEIRERLMGVQIEHLDWRECIEMYNKKNTLFYLDPPYVPEKRVAKSVYSHEMDMDDHSDLVEMLKETESKVMLSGYDNELYNSLGWHVQSTKAKYNGHKWDKPEDYDKTECLWMNYDSSSQIEIF